MKQKVAQTVVMAGRHTFHNGDPVEWNLAGATSQASVCSGGCGRHDNLGAISNRTLSLFPRSVPLVFLDFETGVNVWTGGAFSHTHINSPCERAYKVFCQINQGWCQGTSRCSWDIQAVICEPCPSVPTTLCCARS